ncbi:MAG: hypothetical protein JF607_20160 [Burkholderiales bacterium]|nr:hypothetical protein [Burkholderiales bacterium]
MTASSCSAVAGGVAPDLDRIGRKCFGSAQRAGQQPGVLAALGLVLARRQQHAAIGVLQRLQVDVMADVELVGAHGAVVRQAHVLHQHGRNLAGPGRHVLGLQMPEQRRLAGCEPQLQPQREAIPVATHLEGTVVHMHGQWRQRTQQRRDAPAAAGIAAAQPDIGRPAFQLIAGEEVEHQARREQAAQCAMGQQLGFEAGLVAKEMDGHVCFCANSQGSRSGSW